jgi:hypothetical protein
LVLSSGLKSWCNEGGRSAYTGGRDIDNMSIDGHARREIEEASSMILKLPNYTSPKFELEITKISH